MTKRTKRGLEIEAGLREAITWKRGEIAMRVRIVEPFPAIPLRDRISALQDEALARPATGLEADKTFHDWLSGEEN